MPAIGKDLSKIRSHLGLSIQDIQHHTKIPVSTLKSIENGTIFAHPEENQTYIRSFVRSYARALKIDDDIMIKALDQNERGNYNHLLLEDYPELKPNRPSQSEQESQPEPEEDEQSESAEPHLFDQQESDDREMEYDEEDSKDEEEAEETEMPRIEIEGERFEKISEENQKADKPAALSADVQPQSGETERSVKSVDWADVGRKFNQEKKHTPVWIVGLIIILIIAAFVGYFLYQNGFLGAREMTPEQQEQVTPENETTQSSLSLDLEDSVATSETGTEMETSTPAEPEVQMDEILELTVYAAYDGLGPVRVWSDLKPRMEPYWLEQGTAMQFEFEDTVRVRGSYSDMLLLKDGHLVENAARDFLQQEEDYIQLTRDFFSSDPKWATSIDYELPEDVPTPDSIAARPDF